MSYLPNPDRRRIDRMATKKRASLIVMRWGQVERLPCIILDSSQEGFRVGGVLRLRRGQIVEVVWDDHSVNGLRCKVIWIGTQGSKQEGEAGLQVIR